MPDGRNRRAAESREARRAQILARATDMGGLRTDHGFTISVNDVNEAPVAAADAVAVDEDATTAN